jgi:hypothetical protein
MVLGSQIGDGPAISCMTFRSTFKERRPGFLLLRAMIPMALLGYLIVVVHGFFGPDL